MVYMGTEWKKRVDVCVCIKLIHFAVHMKQTQRWESAILQFFKKIWILGRIWKEAEKQAVDSEGGWETENPERRGEVIQKKEGERWPCRQEQNNSKEKWEIQV